MADFLNIAGSNAFVDATGAPLAAGTLVVEATDGADNPIAFRAGAGKLTVRTRISRTITSGSMDGTLALGNPTASGTSPQSFGYRFTVTDMDSGEVTVYPRVLITDDGTGSWNIGTLDVGQGYPAIPVVKVVGPAGKDGAPGAPGTIGKTNQAMTTADYSQVNPANLLPNTGALPQGTTLFDNGNEFCGDDLGHNLGTYHKRSFSSTGLAYAHVFAPSGTRPTGDSSYTLAGFYLTPYIFNLFPDIGNGLSNPKHSFTRDGDVYHARNLSIAGDFHATNASFAGALTLHSFRANPSGGISSNDFISCNSTGNLPNPATGYGGGYAIWQDGNGNTKTFLDFNCSDYGPRIAMQPGWKLHFATTTSASSNANDCSDFAYMTNSVFAYGPLTIDAGGNITTPGNISAGISAAGDAIAPTQFPPLYQAKTDAISRTYNATSYRVPWAGYTYAAYGDSITYGLYASNPATTGYVPLIAAAVGAAAVDNQGVSSDIVLDTTRRVFNHENCSSSSKRRFSVQIGTNDDHIPTGIVDFKPFHLAVLSWLATVSDDRVDGHIGTAPNWSDDTTYGAVTGKTCSTAGAAITFTVPTYGKPLYIWYQTFQSLDSSGNTVFGTGAFTVQVDGGSAIAVNSFPDGGQPGQTGGIGVKLLRLIVPVGSHAVKITSSTSGKTTIVSLGTPSRNSYYDSPFVAVGGIIPEKDNVQPRAVTFTDWAMDNVRLLQSDGLDVRAVPNRVAMQNGLAALYTDAYHPNDAGYAALAQPYIDVMQRPPDIRYVSRWTPRTSASVGTPGDVWSDDTYVYGVKATGALFRLAAGSW